MSFAFPRGDGGSRETLKNPASDGAGKRERKFRLLPLEFSVARARVSSQTNIAIANICASVRFADRRIARAEQQRSSMFARTLVHSIFRLFLVATPRPILRRFSVRNERKYKRNGHQCSSRKRGVRFRFFVPSNSQKDISH